MQTRLREEIHLHLGKNLDPNSPPTADQIRNLKFLDNVCREVLRIDPGGTALISVLKQPASFLARQALEDDVYEGIRIPKGSTINMPVAVYNMNPSFWGPDAEEFRPDRWDNLKDVQNVNFLTFQNGTNT